MASNTKLIPIDWDDQCNLHLDGVGDLPAAEYWKMWMAKEVNVFAIHQGPGRVGTVIIRWESTNKGGTVAVVVAGGSNGTQDVTTGAIPEIERMARKVNAVGVRMHTRRPGLVRKMAKFAGDRELMIGWRL